MKAKKAPGPIVLCLGNADRGDDAQGACCADILARLNVPARCISGEAFELLELFRSRPRVILIDAIVTGKHPLGHIHRIDGVPADVAPFAPSCSTHGFGLGEALRLGAVLGALPGRLTIFGIESGFFDWGAAPSSEVAASIDTLAHAVAAEYHAATGADSAPRH